MDKMAAPTKLEFAVRMTCQSCVDEIRNVLTGVEGVESFGVDLGVERVVVSTTLPSQKVLELIESTGRQAVIQGMGSDQGKKHLGAAVVQMFGSGVVGVTRMVQVDEGNCVIEGTVDGLRPHGQYSLSIHEFGDISEGCDSCGDVMDLGPAQGTMLYGDLGQIEAGEQGRSLFRKVSSMVKVWDIIGRSMIVSEVDSRTRLACGIVARSAGLFENIKRICACDGVTIWDERHKPVAGSARSQTSNPAAVPSAQL